MDDRIGIEHRNDNAMDTSPDDRIDARWRPTEVRAGLEGDIHISPQRALSGSRQGDHLSV